MHCYFAEGLESVPKTSLFSSIDVDFTSHLHNVLPERDWKCLIFNQI